MILVYHKISLFKKDNITVTLWTFVKQMFQIRKYKIVHLDDYDANNKEQIVIRFDDGYKSFVKYALPILAFLNYPFEVFIVENLYNSANNGDKNFMDKSDLEKLVKNNGRLQYHTKSHPDLSKLCNENQILDEVVYSENLKKLDKKGFKYFAYPFWRYNDLTIDVVRKYYVGALSGNGFAKKIQITL